MERFRRDRPVGPDRPDRRERRVGRDRRQAARLAALHRDPKNWRALGIYHCPQDPRLFVRKRWLGIGWTLNFAHRRALSVVALLLLPALAVGVVIAASH